MDHYGLLALARKLTVDLEAVGRERIADKKWNWAVTPVVFPESHCPYCNTIMRSPCIWFLKGAKHEFLVGVVKAKQGGKVQLINPYHPHGANPMCLGRNPDGLALLSSTVNLSDCSMSLGNIPRWIKEYWNHKCPEMIEHLRKLECYTSIEELALL